MYVIVTPWQYDVTVLFHVVNYTSMVTWNHSQTEVIPDLTDRRPRWILTFRAQHSKGAYTEYTLVCALDSANMLQSCILNTFLSSQVHGSTSFCPLAGRSLRDTCSIRYIVSFLEVPGCVRVAGLCCDSGIEINSSIIVSWSPWQRLTAQ